DANAAGSILIGCDKQRFLDPAFHQSCQQIIDLVSGQLQTVLRANESLLNTALNRLGRLKRSATARNFCIAAAVLIGLLCVPMPYRVWCDCNVQPVERRFVAAPYEGVLAQSLVRGGDQVAANQVVARLDGRLVRGELAGVQAEFDVAKKRRDLALASGDVAQSQIAKSEMQRHQAKVTILNQRLENLEVRSPIDGVVVAGDLEKAVGVPLELGQTLFEIAPLDTMVAEISIPESEAQYVKSGMSVQLKFDSFPFKTFSAEIQRVHPRAEDVDNASVFVADVVLQNSAGSLRPGMSGSAKVSSGWSPLGWNLFHRPWESIRYWTIW
ncbi:efflux RND transporter periplasmic adaptor subunit, partial [Mariniblastus sp.]|nr:efflux RND transporter periplasmic adaptor subunit [Mariniblastus sp.]